MVLMETSRTCVGRKDLMDICAMQTQHIEKKVNNIFFLQIVSWPYSPAQAWSFRWINQEIIHTKQIFFSPPLSLSLSLSIYLYLSIYLSYLSFYLSKCHSFLISSLSFYKPIHLIHVNHLTWSIRSDSLFAPPSSRSSPTIVFSSARALSRSDASFFPFVLTIPWKHIQKSNVQFSNVSLFFPFFLTIPWKNIQKPSVQFPEFYSSLLCFSLITLWSSFHLCMALQVLR